MAVQWTKAHVVNGTCIGTKNDSHPKAPKFRVDILAIVANPFAVQESKICPKARKSVGQSAAAARESGVCPGLQMAWHVSQTHQRDSAQVNPPEPVIELVLVHASGVVGCRLVQPARAGLWSNSSLTRCG